MVHIPTTERQHYNTTPKVNTLGAYASALSGAADDYRKELVRQQQIKVNTESTKMRVESDKFVQEWRLANQANPDNEDAKAQLQSGLQEIYGRYGNNIDPIAKMDWDVTVNKINSAYEIANNQWAINQRAQNAKIDVAENINTNFEKAYEYGKSGDYVSALAELGVSHGQLESYGNSSLGSVETQQLLSDYKKDYLKHFIGGQMMTDPEGAISILEDKQIKNILSDAEVDNLKGFALSKFETAKRMRHYNNIARDIKNGAKMLNNSVNGGLSLEQIQAGMPANASEDYKSLIYSLNGFSNKKGNKVTDDQKSQYLLDIYDQVNQLLSRKDAKPEDFEKLQENLYKGMSVGAVSKKEGLDVLNRIYTPLQESWSSRISPYSEDNWFSPDHGAELVKTFIEKNYTSKPKGKKNSYGWKNADAANKRAMIDGYRVYYNYLHEAAIKNNYSSIADILTETDLVKKNKVLDEAANNTVINFNQKRFEKLRNLEPEKQPNAVLSNGGVVANSNSLANSNIGTPVSSPIKQVRVSGGKYYGRTADGQTVEISEAQYKQFKGL